ncbi:Hypothetical_protein [Hexamita inflata]|uniref:Hypothetical_protein n=1 Tax=Hexamita inflata TaxID=28002 RepID=A0AA86QJP6_9EUKA|nr:Hypothetical protein HINF_LOCUS45267 [Hexamita inflata]
MQQHLSQLGTRTNIIDLGSYLCNYLWDDWYESWDWRISGHTQCFQVQSGEQCHNPLISLFLSYQFIPVQIRLLLKATSLQFINCIKSVFVFCSQKQKSNLIFTPKQCKFQYKDKKIHRKAGAQQADSFECSLLHDHSLRIAAFFQYNVKYLIYSFISRSYLRFTWDNNQQFIFIIIIAANI